MHPELDPATYGLTIWDLDREFLADGLAGQDRMTLGDILGVLRTAAPFVAGTAAGWLVASLTLDAGPRDLAFVAVVLVCTVVVGMLLRRLKQRVLRPGQRPALAYFAREAALVIDAQGYLAVGNRSTQGPAQPATGRIGDSTALWSKPLAMSHGRAPAFAAACRSRRVRSLPTA